VKYRNGDELGMHFFKHHNSTMGGKNIMQLLSEIITVL
jgi:hypothetical protein